MRHLVILVREVVHKVHKPASKQRCSLDYLWIWAWMKSTNPQICKYLNIQIPRLLTTMIQLRLPLQIVQICAQVHQDTRLFVSGDTRYICAMRKMHHNKNWVAAVFWRKVGYFHIFPILSFSPRFLTSGVISQIFPKFHQSRSRNSFHGASAH